MHMKVTTMKVTVDQDKCCGAGQCVLLAPDVFDQREQDAIVVLLDETPAASLHATVREAASVCPAAAITLDESAVEGDAS
jgi:ferredoxin